MASKVLNEARAQVAQALQLCDSETADEIVGSPNPDEYGVLVRGVRAGYQMLWMMAVSNGMKKNTATLKMGAQMLSILLTLVHYAYALGVRRGKESAPPSKTGDLR